MKQANFLTKMLLLFALIVGSTQLWATDYVPVTSTSQLEAGKNYLIVNRYKTSKMTDPTWLSFGTYNSSKSYYGSTSVTVSGDIDDFTTLSITSIDDAHILTLGGEEDSWTLYDNTDKKYVALTNTSNNIHQSDDNSLTTSQWTISIDETGYVATISNNQTSARSIRGNQGSTRFACYEKSQSGNVEYLFVEAAEANTPSITANKVEIAYNDTEGSIVYTINNPVTGGVLTAALKESSDWLTVGTVSSTAVAFTATENDDAARSAIVRLTYTYDTDKTVTKEVTITQAKIPATVVDGYFDFTYTDELDYGTGLQPSGTDIKEAKTFTAGNITITPEPTADNKYWRWWTDGTLRLYTDTQMTIAASDGYVITQIDFEGTQNLNAVTVSSGSYEAASGNKSATWTGCAQSVVFTRNGSNPFYTTIAVTYCPSTVSKVVGTDGWATWIAPNNVEVPSGVTAYIVDGSDATKATLAELLVIPAGEPVLLQGAGTHSFTLCDADALNLNENDPADNLLEVSDDETTDGVYVLAKDTEGVGFYKWTGGLLGAGRVYLPAPTAARAFLAFSFGEETTGIDATLMNSERVNNEVYNLNGQRVAQPTKGLYIVNGKKVVIK